SEILLPEFASLWYVAIARIFQFAPAPCRGFFLVQRIFVTRGHVAPSSESRSSTAPHNSTRPVSNCSQGSLLLRGLLERKFDPVGNLAGQGPKRGAGRVL